MSLTNKLKKKKNWKIKDYLINPHKIGVFHSVIEIQINDIINLLEESVKFDKNEKNITETYNTLRFRTSLNGSIETSWIIEISKRYYLILIFINLKMLL